jgi:3-methylcrotonyl-CoA carboxylase beta subunit
VLTIIKRAQLERRGQTLSDEEAEAIAGPIRAQYEAEGSPYYGTARLWDDGVIAPADTRRVLALALAAAAHAPLEPVRRPVFRM